MIIRVLNENRIIESDAEELSDIRFEFLDNPLNNYIGRNSDYVQIPVLDEILDREITTGLKCRDVIDTNILNGKNEIVQVSFRVEDNGDNSYFLYSNDSKVVEFILDSPLESISTENIPGNLLNADYEIHGKFYQCIHRTKDYIEFVAKKIAEDNGQDWELYYGKALDSSINKFEERWTIKKNGERVNYQKNNAQYQMEEWFGINHKTKERKEKNAKMNVEFRNFRYFVEGVRDVFDKTYGGATKNTSPTNTVIEICEKIQDYRNDGSHSVYSLVYQEGEASLCEAIDRMRTLVNRLGNIILGKELELLKNEIIALFNGKPNDLSINNH